MGASWARCSTTSRDKKKQREREAAERKKKREKLLREREDKRRVLRSPETARKLSKMLVGLVPSGEAIRQLSQRTYAELRASVSAVLIEMRKVAMVTNEDYMKDKAPKRARRRSGADGNKPLVFPKRDVFIPDIGEDVGPDPMTNSQFAKTKERLQKQKSSGRGTSAGAGAGAGAGASTAKTGKKEGRTRKRIAPTLVSTKLTQRGTGYN